MFKAILELDFNSCIKFTIEIPDRVLKGYLDMTIEIDVESYVGTGF